MTPKIISISEKKLIGKKSTMRHGEYGKIIALWKQFMPRKNEIKALINTELIAIQVYSNFNAMDKPFEIRACAEVSNFENIPTEMETFTIPSGDYAIFLHKGINASETYQKIMTEWLPSSGYKIDNRPHFQVMGAKYINGSPDSEEDFYVPVKLVIN
ncbi:GyrI-like domain-containing protein [uncultured Winogradskyella sp.]|uniref:GyrI-like domain-containing protein n=1 Tax=Winogradskyella sp. 4-2091 TaxID=3381659 RepID=UPI002639A7E0|nr:GyrI-like domain-containing protein [uncultured Winogradskyella sp.]